LAEDCAASDDLGWHEEDYGYDNLGNDRFPKPPKE
jgi:hypothetical protein